MTHLPVEKWGRAFLERGLMDARFVKPVYDGEVAELTGSESGGILSIEVHSRGGLCATGTASLLSSAPGFSLAEFREVAPVAERHPVNAGSYEVDKWLGKLPRDRVGDDGEGHLGDVTENGTA